MSLHNAAKAVQSKGRGEDTMLVHMTPKEVAGLQNLAVAHGGSLTINPETGLAEAGFLKSILPMVAGAALSFIPGVGPLMAASLVGGGMGLAKGSLKEGLIAGLGAYGGASLATGLANMGANAGANVATSSATGAAYSPTAGVNSLTSAGAPSLGASGTGFGATGSMYSPLTGASSSLGASGTGFGATGSMYSPLAGASSNVGGQMAQQAMQQAAQQAPASFMGNAANAAKGIGQIAQPGGLSNFGSSFANAARQDVPSAFGLQKIAPYAAGAGLLTGMNSGPGQIPGLPEDDTYQGIYKPQPREAQFPTNRGPNDSSEFSYFDVSNPYPGYMKAATGGQMHLRDGSMVLDSRTVSEAGNGNTNYGQEMLMAAGGQPVIGPGDGVSDSVPATIEGGGRAKLSNGEVVFTPEKVKELGGADKLYAMMDRAAQARKTAERGQNTGGLGALMGA
tara:strand:- start:1882 stop:3234 length:1353 start_codon:yes stop_codon:yes gene_type:complete